MVPEPSLPRHRNVPKRFEVGSGQSHQPSSADEYFRRVYYEAIDLVTNAIRQRFDQPGFKPYSIMETLLLNALKPGIDVTDELKYMLEKYAEDVNVTLLKAQLPVFKLMLSGEFQSFHEIYSAFQSLDRYKKDLISEIVTVFKLILVNPATNAVSERSFSTARRLETLRSRMNQIRFNNLATLMIHTATEQLILTWTKLPLSSPLEMIIESDILVYRCVGSCIRTGDAIQLN